MTAPYEYTYGSATDTSVSYTIIATDADGIALSQTPGAAGNLTLNGTLISDGALTLTSPQRVTVACAGSDAGRTFTITGTDYDGVALVEAIAGSAGGSTTSTKSFLTVTSIAVDDATAGAVTAGVLGAGEMGWIPINYKNNPVAYGYHVDIGTATFTVEGTLDDLSVTSVPMTIEASGSVDVLNSSTIPVKGLRVKVTAFTSGTITFRVLQAG